MERALGITPPATPAFRPNAEDDAARAERLRLARQARQARESGVFFQISARDPTGKASTQPAAAPGASSSAAVDIAQSDARRPQLAPKHDQNYQGSTKIRRASCRELGGQYVLISVVGL